MERGPRYSKWKVTKRSFKLGSSQGSEEQNALDTSRHKKGSIEDQGTPRKRTKQGNKSTTSSSSTPHKHQNENEGLSASVGGDSLLQPELEASPVKFARLIEDTPPPGDVSVSFLASTPKPGRPQLSRRRPLSSVRENSDLRSKSRSSSESTNVPSKTSEKKTQKQKSSISKTSTEISQIKAKKSKASVPITSFKSSQRDKSEAGKSLENKMTKISQSVVQRKRQSGKKTPEITSSSRSKLKTALSIEKTVSQTGSLARSRTGSQTESLSRSRNGSQTDSLSRSRSGSQTESLSRSRNGSQTVSLSRSRTASQTESLSRSQTGLDTGSHTTLERSLTRSTSHRIVSTSEETSDDDDQIPTKKKFTVNERVQKKTKHVNKSAVTNVKNKTVKKTGKRGMLQAVSDSSDDTRVSTRSPVKRNKSMVKSASLDMSPSKSAGRKKGYNGAHKEVTGKVNPGRKASTAANIPKDHTVMLWQTEEQKRSRRDVLDLDLVLNSVMETMESAMDVYELQDGQSAARLLKKYLVKDVTHMIGAAQTVTHLQTRIKQGHQSIKQKQKKLMSLQNERMELEEKCLPSKQLREKNEKMTAINDFLSDLQTVINQC